MGVTTGVWLGGLRKALVDVHGSAGGERTFARYAGGLPPGFQESYPPRLAADCVAAFEEYAGSAVLRLLGSPSAGGDDIRLALVWSSPMPALLADVIPVLENLGLRVADHRPFDIRPEPGEPLRLEEFRLLSADVAMLSDPSVRDLVGRAFGAVWNGEADDDGFNRLVLGARLGWREAWLKGSPSSTSTGCASRRRTVLGTATGTPWPRRRCATSCRASSAGSGRASRTSRPTTRWWRWRAGWNVTTARYG